MPQAMSLLAGDLIHNARVAGGEQGKRRAAGERHDTEGGKCGAGVGRGDPAGHAAVPSSSA